MLPTSLPRVDPILLALLLAIAPATASQGAAPGAEVPLRLSDTVIPVGAELDLSLVPEDDAFRGRVAIDVEVRQPTSQIWLNARDLTVGSAVVTQGERELAATAEARGRDFLLLSLPEALAAGPARIAIDHEGRVERVDTTGVFGQEQDGEHYLFTQFEATDARRAFPSFDEPRFKHPWQVTLRVPEADLAFSNTPAAEESVADGIRTVRFAETRPLPTYLLAFAVGPFDVVDLGRGGAGDTPMRLIVQKGDGADTGYAGSTVAEILGWMEEYFGIPYPYEKLDQVAIPQTVGFGAMEHPGLITYARSLMVTPEDELSLRSKIYWDSVLAHELGHQWFGNLVTLAWWDDIWLNEGFASWIGDKTMAALRPDWGSTLEVLETRDRAMGADSLISARKVRQPIAGNDDIANAFDGITYAKGSVLLAMFESWLGEERFRDAIRHYLRSRSHGIATSDDFLAALATTGEPDAPKAFAGFLDQAGVPMVGVSLACPEGGTPELRLRQERFLPVGSAGDADQDWLLPLCVRHPSGGGDAETVTTCGLLREPAGTLPLSAAEACPDWVLANAGQRGYYRAAYEGDLLSRLLAEEGSRLTEAELLGVLGDTVALAEAGRVPLDTVLATLLPFGDHPRHQVASLVLGLVRGIEDDLVPAGQQEAYAALVRDAFGARARALGFSPSPTDTPDEALLRPGLLRLVGDEGRDPEIRATADRLALAWLEDRNAIDPELEGVVLSLAALDGDTALFDRMLAAARSTEDAEDRQTLLSALASFRDPQLRARALGLFFDEGFNAREGRRLLRGAVATEEGQEQLWRFLQENWERVVDRLPEQSRGSLPYYASNFCSVEKARELERFFRPRLDELEGAPRNLARAVEGIELCAAYQEAQRPAVARFLSAPPSAGGEASVGAVEGAPAVDSSGDR